MDKHFKYWLRTAGAAVLAGTVLLSQPVQAQGMPNNLGRGLTRLVELNRTNPASADKLLKGYLVDRSSGRLLVNVRLNGKVSLTRLVSELKGSGMQVTATTRFNRGIVEGYLDLSRVVAVARLPGVQSVLAVPRPVTDVGATTNQAVTVQQADAAQALGFNGQGIKVGVLSDSYNTADATTSAEDDISTGDLPGTGNPLGNTTPVVVLQDVQGSDEGRAMLQLIHDLAPKAALAFATASGGEVTFANNIIALREQFGADVIVDDVFYFSEPIYSDGVIAAAVDQVVADGAGFYSSAGNRANQAYETTYAPVSVEAARDLVSSGAQNLKLRRVLATSTVTGFHDFDPGSGVDISQSFTVLPATTPPPGTTSISFQWDEPFGVGAVATDYNLLVFSADGTYRGLLSGTDNNVSTDEALELLTLPQGEYQLVIAKANEGPANRLKYLYNTDTGVSAEFLPGGPSTFGHKAARGVQAVAAAFYGTPDIPEGFTSLGPSVVYFDSAGNPLAEPEVRQVPQITSVDGSNNTFFGGNDAEGDGFPNFFGTSAAAPNAAGIAALVLQAAGGPGSLSPQELYSALQNTAVDIPFDADTDFSKVVIGPLTVTGNGDSSNASSSDPNFFKITLAPSATGETVAQVVIDLTAAGLVFDTSEDVGFPFTLGTLVGVNASDVTVQVADDTPVLTLTFAPGSFGPGDSVSFGVDRDVAGAGGGNDADQLAKAIVSAQGGSGAAGSGAFVNEFGPPGYDPLTGFGLVDALGAVNIVP